MVPSMTGTSVDGLHNTTLRLIQVGCGSLTNHSCPKMLYSNIFRYILGEKHLRILSRSEEHLGVPPAPSALGMNLVGALPF